jgi:hypothetical protein
MSSIQSFIVAAWQLHSIAHIGDNVPGSSVWALDGWGPGWMRTQPSQHEWKHHCQPVSLSA